MSTKSYGQSSDEIAAYVYETLQLDDEALAFAHQNAVARGLPEIQVSPADARHLEILVRLLGAKKAVEIGTLGGYSGISIARGLGAGGRLHTFELDPHHSEVARTAFQHARLMAEIKVHEGPALENLPRINNEAPFDVVFIDADKWNYPRYLAWATDHLRIGGAVIGDNTFAWGDVHRAYDLPPEKAKAIAALREFNQTLASSARFRTTILPTGEGMTVGIKIS
jgi:caffeoyl-CoA O-methyltransferase